MQLRHSKVKYKFIFYKESYPPSPLSLLKLPNAVYSSTETVRGDNCPGFTAISAHSISNHDTEFAHRQNI